MPEYVIELNSDPISWVDYDVEGDPGRTTMLERATKFSTHNEPYENMGSLSAKYGWRKFQIREVSR